MKKVIALSALVLVFGVGCGGDPREAHINNVLTALNNTSSQLNIVKKKLTEVLKKEKITAEDMKEINDTVEKIREEGGKLLQEVHRRIIADTEKRPLTKEEQEKYKARFAGQVESVALSLDQETRAIIPLLDELEKKSKTLASELRKNLGAANSDFQQIASRK